MTREEIETFRAGDEMDRAVAKAMGWRVVPGGEIGHQAWYYTGDAPGSLTRPVPRFSVDIAEAWIVFNESPNEHRCVEWTGGHWTVHITGLIRGQRVGDFNSIVTADTAPLAICRAFLIAKMYEAQTCVAPEPLGPVAVVRSIRREDGAVIATMEKTPNWPL